MGAVTPIGQTVDSFWDSLLACQSGVSTVTLFDTSPFEVHFGGEVSDFEPTAIDRKQVKRLDRFAQFALAAADQAVRQSGLNLPGENPDRVGVIIGSGIGGLSELEDQHVRLLEKGPSKVSAFTIPKLMVNAASGNLSIRYGACGPSTAVGTACASATNAMGDALNCVRRGDCDVMITGGSEAALTPLGLAAFAAMKALSTRNEDPSAASRPFDRDRDGFVLGEGAGILIFEEYEHARRRGARIFAEVAGFGTTADASHITQPSEDGVGAAKAMQAAIADAGWAPDSMDYINAHGTSTPLGDVAETIAIKRVFGQHARRIPVSSTKSSIGHLLGASGGVEAIATVLAIANSVAPPTINLDNPGEGCDLDYVPNAPRDCRIRRAMSNSFGFGGHNACIVFQRID
jgi:3-oxoacyl-[acyl-carrier-protein] synthase II